jgi:ProP effector
VVTPSQAKIDKVLALLCERFPRTFVCYEGRRWPLKVGITKDLERALGTEVDGKLLRQALSYYTLSDGYLKSQRPGAPRLDLDGNAAGVVTSQEARYARGTLAKIKAQRKKPPSATQVRKKRLALGLAALKAATLARKQAAGGAA